MFILKFSKNHAWVKNAGRSDATMTATIGQTLVQVENQFDWISAQINQHRKKTTIEFFFQINQFDRISAQVNQPIIESRQQLNSSIRLICCVCVAKILLFVCLSTLIEKMRFYDEFVKILQSPPPPSSTFSVELGTAVVIQLLLQEAGPNNSLQTL